MSAVTTPRILAATAVAVALAAVFLTRGRTAGDAAQIAPSVTDPAPGQISTGVAGARSAEVRETPAAAKLRELRALSETYRNTTFLIAIRDAGFVCNDLLDVYGGVNDSTAWTATCSEMLAYSVKVASSGALQIDPMLQHLDSVFWGAPREPGRAPGRDPMPILPAPNR